VRKQTLQTIKRIWLEDRKIATHFEGCWKSHPICAISRLVDEIQRMKIDLDKKAKTINSYQKLKAE